MVDTPEPWLEAVAAATKAEIGRQFCATHAPGPNPGDDWTARANWDADGGMLDLTLVARAAVAAYLAWLKDHGPTGCAGGFMRGPRR